MFHLVAEFLRRNRTVVYLTDYRREVYNFLRLAEFKGRVAIHTPREISIDPENVVLTQEEIAGARVLIHPPVEGERVKHIFKNLLKGGLNVIDDAAQAEGTQQIMEFIEEFIRFSLRSGRGNYALFIDEFQYIAPTQFGTQYKGHLKDANVIADYMNKFRSSRISLIGSSQTTKKINIDGVKNMNNIIIFKIDPETAADIYDNNLVLLPYDFDTFYWQIAKIPDPLMAIMNPKEKTPQEFYAIAFNRDTNFYNLHFKIPPSPFTRTFMGRSIPGTDPVPVSVQAGVQLSAKARDEIMLFYAFRAANRRGMTYASILREMEREIGVTVPKQTVSTKLKKIEKLVESLRQQREMSQGQE